jgi:ribonuclease P protein component
MLSASQRLRKSSEISAVLRAGTRYTSKLVVLHVATGSNPETRVAFAISKKVGNSVVRHRLTRQLRHSMSLNLNRFPQGSQIVVRALPGAGSAKFSEISENIDFAVTKAVSA